MGIDDASLRAEMCCDIRLDLDMDVLSSVEVWGAAGTDTVCAQGGDGSLFDLLVATQVVVVVSREVRDGLASQELSFRSRRSTERYQQ